MSFHSCIDRLIYDSLVLFLDFLKKSKFQISFFDRKNVDLLAVFVIELIFEFNNMNDQEFDMTKKIFQSMFLQLVLKIFHCPVMVLT
jgi:hypothetical protein